MGALFRSSTPVASFFRLSATRYSSIQHSSDRINTRDDRTIRPSTPDGSQRRVSSSGRLSLIRTTLPSPLRSTPISTSVSGGIGARSRKNLTRAHAHHYRNERYAPRRKEPGKELGVGGQRCSPRRRVVLATPLRPAPVRGPVDGTSARGLRALHDARLTRFTRALIAIFPCPLKQVRLQ
jgi:hypothetical protein